MPKTGRSRAYPQRLVNGCVTALTQRLDLEVDRLFAYEDGDDDRGQRGRQEAKRAQHPETRTVDEESSEGRGEYGREARDRGGEREHRPARLGDLFGHERRVGREPRA